MLRVNKNIKIAVNYVAGPLLFCWLMWRIYEELLHTPHLQQSWQAVKTSMQTGRFFYAPLVLLLMVVNWALEAAKWQTAVHSVHPAKFGTAFKAVLLGLSFAVTTPNRIGEYLGRMLYMPEGKRLQIISLTLVCSYSQILLTGWCGLFALLFLKQHLIQGGVLSARWWTAAASILSAGNVILTILYFLLPHLQQRSQKWFQNKIYLHLVRAVGFLNGKTQLKLLVLSALRYGVFLLQYILLFRLFGVMVPVQQSAAATSLQFLALALIPTIALVELGLRGQLGLLLMGLFTTNTVGVLFTSVGMWVINLVLPATVGSLLLLTVRLFTREPLAVADKKLPHGIKNQMAEVQ